jgi:capsid assembly protease
MKMLPHIAGRVLGTPLVIGQVKLEAILSALGPRIGIEAPAAMDGDVRRRRSCSVTSEGIAMIPVFGTLVKRAGTVEAASGLTSYSDLETEILDAATDPAVRAILLDADSPGGEAGGVFDLADLVYEARGHKPVWAVADEEAFSGAYAIVSAAERIIVPRTGGVGSIGVVAVHVDRSARDAMEGYRYTTVFAGARKNDFNPHQAFHGEARATLQAEVDRIHELFVQTVARNRGMTVDAVRKTEAGLFFGEAAVRAGLADEMGTLRDAMVALTESLSGYRPMIRAAAMTATPHHPKEETMTDIINETPGLDNAPPAAENGARSEPRPDTAANASNRTAEVVDLDKVRAEARGEGQQEAVLIADLCALAGMPERTGEMISRRLSADAVRKELLALKADHDGDEVQSHVLPGAGTGRSLDLNDNPVVRAARARATAAKEA